MTVDDYVCRMAAASQTPEHEVIPECLEAFGLTGTRELTVEQAAEWWERYYALHDEE